MVADETVLEGGEPAVSAGVGGAEGVCGGEGDACDLSPLVHVADAAGEDDLCLCLGGHWSCGQRRGIAVWGRLFFM